MPDTSTLTKTRPVRPEPSRTIGGKTHPRVTVVGDAPLRPHMHINIGAVASRIGRWWQGFLALRPLMLALSLPLLIVWVTTHSMSAQAEATPYSPAHAIEYGESFDAFVRTDTGTGCQYMVVPGVGITPRNGPDHQQICTPSTTLTTELRPLH